MVGNAAELDGEDSVLDLKGCRADTLSDFLRLIDIQVREMHLRAATLPTAAGNEWLRDFLKPKVIVEPRVSVLETRKELEAAAQKQKEMKEAKGELSGGGEDSFHVSCED